VRDRGTRLQDHKEKIEEWFDGVCLRGSQLGQRHIVGLWGSICFVRKEKVRSRFCYLVFP